MHARRNAVEGCMPWDSGCDSEREITLYFDSSNKNFQHLLQHILFVTYLISSQA